MADEDNKITSQNTDVQGLKSEMDAKLSEVQEQLKAMNASFADGLKSLASAVNPPKPDTRSRITDEDIYDAERLEEKVARKAGEIADNIVQQNRELDTMIYNLAQDYPEINSSPELQKAVREAQASLPKEVRNTAFGIKSAVLEAVSKQGIVPKSKRQVQTEDDFSISRGRGNPETRTGQKGKSAKLDQNTLDFARLLGKNVEDPEYIKRLQSAASRDTFSKYR